MKPQYTPSLEDFRARYDQGNVIPVYRQLMADTITPVLAFQKVAAGPYSFLLESAAGPENIGRYCFLGSEPFAIFSATGSQVTITEGEDVRTFEADDPLQAFQEYLEQFKLVPLPGLPRFACGAVGYMAYDVVRFVENLPDCPADDRGLPDIFYMFFDEILIFDNLNKTLKVVASQRTQGMEPEAAYQKAIDRINRMIARLRAPLSSISDDIEPTGEIDLDYRVNCEREDFMDAVERCKEYIRAGDIFQVVPSVRLTARTNAQPLEIYRSLRVINPSPYMFLLRIGQTSLVGASPEVMVRVENGVVSMRPIAGTRKRGADEAEDERLAAELLADPKERAEHIMLVDLARNDVGRVSDYGTVQCDEIMVIEKYSHVMHIVSNVHGKLREGMSALDALKACLPAGTLSGAPKVRAMEIIDEMERTKRGPYGGAVGYFDFSGNMDTCITIRTLVLQGKQAHVQAGAGIVADSVPASEWQECLNKAKALLRAIQVAEMMGM